MTYKNLSNSVNPYPLPYSGSSPYDLLVIYHRPHSVLHPILPVESPPSRIKGIWKTKRLNRYYKLQPRFNLVTVFTRVEQKTGKGSVSSRRVNLFTTYL